MAEPARCCGRGCPLWHCPHHDCIVQVDGDRLTVVRADPCARISGELLDQIRAGEHHPDVSLNGDVLTIDAVNQRVVYRIRPRPAEPRPLDIWLESAQVYEMEWPD